MYNMSLVYSDEEVCAALSDFHLNNSSYTRETLPT